MDAITHRLERDIRELTYDLRPGSEQALEVRASLLRQLEQIRLSIPRRDAIRLEGLIDSTTKGAT
jgi:hypothetical protein